MPAGRPTLLTPTVLEDVARLLPTVMYLETVGDYLGIHRTTWGNWLRRGRSEFNRLVSDDAAEPDPQEAVYLEFFIVHKKAIAEGEIHDAGILKKAASGTLPAEIIKTTHPDGTVTEMVTYANAHWQAAAWRLERRFPERWGRDKALLLELLKDVKELRRAHQATESTGEGSQESGGSESGTP